MRRRLAHILTLAALLTVALATGLTASASAEVRTIEVQLADGSVSYVVADVTPGACPEDIGLPGTPLRSVAGSGPTAEQALLDGGPDVVPGSGSGADDCGSSEDPPDGGDGDGDGGGDDIPPEPEPQPEPEPKPEPDPDDEPDPDTFPDFEPGGGNGGNGTGGGGGGGNGGNGGGGNGGGGGGGRGDFGDVRNPDGSPSRSNPSRVEVSPTGGGLGRLPGPAVRPVPSFIIEKFRVPIFLLPIYQAAGTQYGVRWEVLAAINEIETDYGRNLAVSTAGAVGWMQFLPSTWRTYGVDANGDGKKDPWNPVDSIFAAARYLKAAGYGRDVRGAIFAYNHADWYVDSVLMRARVIAGIPGDLTGSLTGLTEGQFPVYAKARYADDLSEAAQKLRARREGSAQGIVSESDVGRRGIEIYTREGAPVIASNDGQVTDIGRDEMGRYVTLQDVYGNSYTYRGLSEVADSYPVPKGSPAPVGDGRTLPAATGAGPAPGRAASAGRRASSRAVQPAYGGGVQKRRLFAHPRRANSYEAGGRAQVAFAETTPKATGHPEPGETGALGKGFTIYRQGDAEPLRLSSENTRAVKLREGSRVVQGTVLGKVGRPDPHKAAHLYFEIRPVGRGAPKIDPKPILDGWKLLEETAIYRAGGQNVLSGGSSVGQLLLLSKPLLERRVLADERIEVYQCGRRDIRTGQIDRRVLITLAYLAESGLRPTVTSLKCGHSTYTASGNVSNHSSGNAVDIAQLNGVPVLGHQDRGGIVAEAVKRILLLQGTMRPDELISLFNYGGPSFAMADHADHIHVGFTPLYGARGQASKKTLRVLRPKQWHTLIDRLGEIDQPKVQRGPKRFTTGDRRRASKAHRGE